ncbi:ABC transporter permease [Streptomyces indicus]|uniref:NitT/TauT family transport system permease protein n=1 Tax=Streptomyces indicus TaxID=417292 RepID=A0A1G8U3W0_9ACTN|nr:ABC transporter permease [Streptomyces indicus]SDJ48482.1 NitT/TauT family transport system permease protein [Streptomyces indicus]
MSQSALSSAPVKTAGVALRESPSARERFADAVEKSWRPVALLVACFVAWWVIAAMELVEPYLVPSPGKTFEVILDKPDYLWQHSWVTTYETLIGFVVAVAIGVLAAVVMVYSTTVEKTLYPILLFAQVVPKIAIAPLFVVWLGFGIAPKIVIAVLIAFFPVVISMVTGLKAVDPEMLQLSSTMGASPWQTFVKIRFPASLPHLFSGLKVAVTLAVTGAVVGEFVGANEGLGYVILQANGNLDTPMLFAGLLVMSLIGVVLFVIVELAEKLLLPWHASRRESGVTTAF